MSNTYRSQPTRRNDFIQVCMTKAILVVPVTNTYSDNLPLLPFGIFFPIKEKMLIWGCKKACFEIFNLEIWFFYSQWLHFYVYLLQSWILSRKWRFARGWEWRRRRLQFLVNVLLPEVLWRRRQGDHAETLLLHGSHSRQVISPAPHSSQGKLYVCPFLICVAFL